VASVFVSLLGLSAFFLCTCSASNAEIRRATSKVERYSALFHYALVLPLFEVVGVWGSKAAPDVFSSLDAGLVLGWLLVHCVALAMLVLGVCRATRSHRYFVHMAHVLYFPMGFVLAVHHAVHSSLGSDAIAYWTLTLSTAIAVVNVPRVLRPGYLCVACEVGALRKPRVAKRSIRSRFRRPRFTVESDDETSEQFVFDTQRMDRIHMPARRAESAFDNGPVLFSTDALDISDDTIGDD